MQQQDASATGTRTRLGTSRTSASTMIATPIELSTMNE